MTGSSFHPGGSPLRPGDKLDKYAVVEQIGAGGSSIVWKGYDALLDRHVAIKQLLSVQVPGFPGASGEEEETLDAAFQREVDLQRALSERLPRVVKVLDYVREPRGRFIVMELVEGQTLEQLLSSQGAPFKVSAATRIVHAMAKALEGVHAQGVIHRDLKPTNVLMTKDTVVKLADLGLATLIAEQEALTLGSVKYMAPELRHGPRNLHNAADGRADLYALGMIAYEMLVGRDRFNEAFRSVVRDGSRQAMRWVKWHTNPRLAPPPLVELNPQCPPWLGELVGRMLEKDPLKRIASASDVIGVIERHTQSRDSQGAPTARTGAQAAASPVPLPVPRSAAPTTSPNLREGDTAPLPKRRIGVLVTATLIIVTCLAGGGFWIYQASEAGRVEAAKRAEAAASMRAAQAHYKAGEYEEAAAVYQQVGEAWRDDPAIGKPAAAGLLLAEARLAMERGEHEAARERLLQLDEMDVVARDEVYDLLEEADRRATFTKHVAEIEARIGDGRFAEARRLLREWRDITLAAEEEERLAELRVRVEDQVNQRLIGDVIAAADRLVASGKRDQAIDNLALAQERYRSPRIKTRLEELTTQRRFEEALARADALYAAGAVAEAIGAYSDAISVRDDEAVAEKLRRLKSQAAVDEGRKLLALKDQAGAREAFARALGFAENAEAQAMLSQLDDSERKQALVDAGDRSIRQGEFDAAAEHYRQALELGEDRELSEKVALARASRLVEEGNRRLQQGDFEAARDAFKEAQELSVSVQGAGEGLQKIGQRTQYLAHLQTGDALRAQSKFAEAKIEYRRARDAMDTPEVRERFDDADFDHMIAQARGFIAAEEWRAAEAVLKTAAQMRPGGVIDALMDQVRNRDPGDPGNPGEGRG